MQIGMGARGVRMVFHFNYFSFNDVLATWIELGGLNFIGCDSGPIPVGNTKSTETKAASKAPKAQENQYYQASSNSNCCVVSPNIATMVSLGMS